MENAFERILLLGIEIVFSDFLECYRKELGERILKREISRRGMLEEDASAVTYHNFTAFSAGEENDIHRHLCAESQFVHGVCARRNNLSLVTFGNSLGNLIKTGIDDTQSQVRVCFRVAIDTPCHADDAAPICQSFKCFLHRDSCPILRKTRRGEYSPSSAFSNRFKYLIINRLHIIIP